MSFKIIDVDIPKKLDTIVCYSKQMPVPICNHFYVRRANSGKITPFKGVPLFHPLVCGDPFYPAA